jgi:hypothetical protein
MRKTNSTVYRGWEKTKAEAQNNQVHPIIEYDEMRQILSIADESKWNSSSRVENLPS